MARPLNLTEAELHAVEDGLAYYQMSDCGFGDIGEYSAEDEAHKAAVASALAKAAKLTETI